MRITTVILLLAAILVADVAQAQTAPRQGSPALPASIELRPDVAALARASSPAWPAPNHCCSKKGALIGAAIGAGLGAALTLYLCDAGDCTPSMLRTMGILGGIGAALGAATAHSRGIRVPALPSRIDISPAFGHHDFGAVVNARF